MMSRIITPKSFLLATGILLVVSILCTQIPLLNYLGYEFSFLIALIAGFICGLFAIAVWKRALPQSDPHYWSYVRTVLAGSLLVIVPPLLIISVNAVFVKNCSITQGFRLYALYVVPSIVFCVSLAILSSVLARKYSKTLFSFLFIAVLAHIPYVTLAKPQIFAFNPIAGYFPGFTYDESLTGEVRLLIYRISTLAVSALILTLAVIVWRFLKRDFKRAGSKTYSVRYVAFTVACLVVSVGLYRLSDTLGLSSSETFIASQLGGVRNTTHFRIVYPTKSVNENKLREIEILHEYLYDELCQEWKVNPRKRIAVYIYNSPEQKERLVGAANTDFTKPWLRQIHINLGDVNGALKHELVHAILADQGIPFLQVAPNSGLIEGAAVSSERFEYDESLHHLAAEIFALGISPDVAQMFSVSGFFKSYPGVSYVLAGSFCRYLIDRYGVDRFKELYRTGGFESLYRKNAKTLVKEWKDVISSISITDRDLLKATYLFKRSPLFGKECARVIANLNANTRELIDRKEYSRALASAEWSMSLSRSTDAVYQKCIVLFRLEKYEQAIDFMQRQLADSSVRSSVLPLHLTLGDCYWGLHEFDKAKSEYAEMLADSLSVSMNEAAAIRLQIFSDTAVRNAMQPYFLQEKSDSARIAFLDHLTETPSTDIIARYLLGKEYSTKENDSWVIEELQVLSPMDSPIMEYLRNLRIARALYNLGNYEQSKLYSWRALNDAANDAQLYQLGDFLQRCTWIRDHQQ
jgi:tetratricopeptide (TPR) repeat protein